MDFIRRRIDITILLAGFNSQVGREKVYRDMVGKYAAHKNTNCNGKRLMELRASYGLKLMSTPSKKLRRERIR